MNLKTRNYINSFIEIKVDEIETTCYNKTQAEELKQTLLEAVEDLEVFIEKADD
tara:strand:- start:65 stop:226 length:162 start_codon:yes stop_codon:yes gene_type:complete